MRPGDTFRHPYRRGPGFNPKCHFLTFVDDEYAVFRWYGRYQQWWHYEVLHISEIKSKEDQSDG